MEVGAFCVRDLPALTVSIRCLAHRKRTPAAFPPPRTRRATHVQAR
jgi:hypothetical protein